MDILSIVLVAAVVFGVCFLVDKGFTRVFRSKPQHISGKSVRLNKYYGVGGILMTVLGVAAVFAGMAEPWLLLAGGILLIVLGIGLIIYYMTFGVYYDEDSFLLTTFGKRSTAYRYGDIRGQLLYNSYGHIIIELHMSDGRTVQMQSSMTDVYVFLDHAFAAWCRQQGKRQEDCPFHDPDNSCWFPTMED